MPPSISPVAACAAFAAFAQASAPASAGIVSFEPAEAVSAPAATSPQPIPSRAAAEPAADWLSRSAFGVFEAASPAAPRAAEPAITGDDWGVAPDVTMSPARHEDPLQIAVGDAAAAVKTRPWMTTVGAPQAEPGSVARLAIVSLEDVAHVDRDAVGDDETVLPVAAAFLAIAIAAGVAGVLIGPRGG